MIKRRFLFNKLVRDKALNQMISEGVVAETKVLTDNDMFLEAITQKMIEELEEVFSCESQEELIEELADFEDAFAEFKKLITVTPEEIAKVRAAKIAKKGSYSSRLFCDYIDVPETLTSVIEYCESKSDKYPELDPITNDFLDSDLMDMDDEEDDE